jgi:uncharacterized protein
MKVAIVGAGVSGLVAAYRLAPEHDVTVFDANDHAGGHARTVTVEVDGDRFPVDVGFMVFNESTYPAFTSLLNELGIASQAAPMSFSVSDPAAGLEYCSRSLNGLFAQRRNLLRAPFYRMLRDILRFNRLSRRLAREFDDQATVGEFVRDYQLSREFVDHYLYPMGSAIWSCPRGAFAEFPVRFIFEFFQNHGLNAVRARPQWRVIVGGSENYVAAIAGRLGRRLRLSCPVDRVERTSDRVRLRLRSGPCQEFDQVILACHSDEALELLGDGATQTERDVLSSLAYQSSVGVLHTDESLLPSRRRAWASWNYRINAADAATVTYNVSMLQGHRARQTFCVTLNDTERIDPKKVLRTFHFAHPKFDGRRAASQARHLELIGANRTSFCGAYWRNGFHEDGAVSALAVVEALHRVARAGSRRNASALPATRSTPLHLAEASRGR